ncbi:uncharacterized protein LOC128724688 [Anopheles nili]|uniref:uncharacterized protein LOC128724688 n=1 Tax=Anopheles nili TaxID=185578 RepID=UPI00237A3374|nr:uncharacterized protein LOC128724688 [Anopheles nili]
MRVPARVAFVQCLVVLLVVTDRTVAISYRTDTGFATNSGMDQFVFREPIVSVPAPARGSFTDVPVKRTGRVRFSDAPDTSTFSGVANGGGFFGTGTVADSSPASGSPFVDRDREGDQFYTVGASIKFAGAPGDAITPPPPLPIENPQPQKPKRRKNPYKFAANEKVYHADDPVQGQYPAYASFGEPQRFSTPLQGNYLTPNGANPAPGQYDNSIHNYPELQRPQYPFNVKAPYSGANYYSNPQTPGPSGTGGLYSPYQYQYPSPYASESPYPTGPYQQGPPQSYYTPQPQQTSGFGQPPNAQSILGVLQSIFNFAPGTFGTTNAAPTRPGGVYSSPGAPTPFGGVGGQLRQALDNISDNDELQCVPKLICMMSRSSSGQGFSSYVNRGLLSTVLTAVPDSSPWLKFSRAALLGYGIGANSCDAYYPKCPKDEMQILYYLNNHRGGFFRFFSNGDQQGLPHQQQQQQYG